MPYAAAALIRNQASSLFEDTTTWPDADLEYYSTNEADPIADAVAAAYGMTIPDTVPTLVQLAVAKIAAASAIRAGTSQRILNLDDDSLPEKLHEAGMEILEKIGDGRYVVTGMTKEADQRGFHSNVDDTDPDELHEGSAFVGDPSLWEWPSESRED